MNFKKLMALLLAVCLCVGIFSGCGSKSEEELPTPTPAPTAAPAATSEPERYPRAETLAVATGKLTGVYSPFFSTAAGDVALCDLTQLHLIETDRGGQPILQGITAETRTWNGETYSYVGVTDVTVTPQADGRVFYDITMRDDLKFSDGVPVTVDDVIFTLYVLSDPTYDGPASFAGCPIEGMEAYWSDRIPLYVLLNYVGPENQNFRYWTRAQQKAFWEQALPAAGAAYAQAAVDHCMAEGWNAPGDSVASCAAHWWYDLEEDATTADFFHVLEGWYDNDYLAIADCLGLDVTLWQLLEDDYKMGVPAGETVDTISGIQRTGAYSLRLVTTEADADLLSWLDLPIAPLHYYGDESKYDYAGGTFGFDKGDLRDIRAKSGCPLGAGPYVYLETWEGAAYLEANPYYYQGTPARRYLSLRRIDSAADNVAAVTAGEIDISQALDCKAMAEAIDQAGVPVHTASRPYAGYGYVGLNANNVKVGEDPGSEASRLLRKGICIVLAAYREQSVSEYYGDGATVIDAPISTATWLAPEAAAVSAFALDKDGAPIYTAEMSQSERRKAAVAAALDCFAAAGYTVEDGVITAAPEGAKLQYELRYGSSDHPCAMMIQEATLALYRVGLTLHLEQADTQAELESYYCSASAELWCAAWYHGAEPALRLQYHSQGLRNVFGLADGALDTLIETLDAALEPAERKALYGSVMDTVLDWAVELPVYQRTEVYALADGLCMPQGLSPFYDWTRDITAIR